VASDDRGDGSRVLVTECIVVVGVSSFLLLCDECRSCVDVVGHPDSLRQYSASHIKTTDSSNDIVDIGLDGSTEIAGQHRKMMNEVAEMKMQLEFLTDSQSP